MNHVRYLSLFSGIGGFELGIQQAYKLLDNQETGRCGQEKELSKQGGGNPSCEPIQRQYPPCIGFSEIDKYAISIYERHFPEHKNLGDITKVPVSDIPDHDLLVGGFPCQAFSIAGKRQGFADTRGTLFFDIARIAKHKRPRLLLLENVKGLLSHDQGATFKTILTTFDELGYDLQWQVLNSKDFGVPQNRERVFIVGHLRGTPRPEVFPFGESSEEGAEELGLQGTRQVATTLRATDYKGTHNNVRELSRTVRGSGIASPHGSKQNWDSYALGGQIRRLTPTECERLQGFPDGWTEGVSDTQRYKCLGNAVTVNVIQVIAERLL